jgi:hypothetical protein
MTTSRTSKLVVYALFISYLLVALTPEQEIAAEKKKREEAAKNEKWTARDDIAQHKEGDAMVTTSTVAHASGNGDTIKLKLVQHTVNDLTVFKESFKNHMDPDNAKQVEDLKGIDRLINCIKMTGQALWKADVPYYKQIDEADFWTSNNYWKNYEKVYPFTSWSEARSPNSVRLKSWKKHSQIFMEVGCPGPTPMHVNSHIRRSPSYLHHYDQYNNNHRYYNDDVAYFDIWMSVTSWNGLIAAIKAGPLMEVERDAYINGEMFLVDRKNCPSHHESIGAIPKCTCTDDAARAEDRWCCAPAIDTSSCDQVILDIQRHSKKNRISYEFAHCFRAVFEDDNFTVLKEKRRWTCVNKALADADKVIYSESMNGMAVWGNKTSHRDYVLNEIKKMSGNKITDLKYEVNADSFAKKD